MKTLITETKKKWWQFLYTKNNEIVQYWTLVFHLKYNFVSITFGSAIKTKISHFPND